MCLALLRLSGRCGALARVSKDTTGKELYGVPLIHDYNRLLKNINAVPCTKRVTNSPKSEEE